MKLYRGEGAAGKVMGVRGGERGALPSQGGWDGREVKEE